MSVARDARRRNLGFAIALAVAAGLWLAHVHQFAGYAQDDAFISFSYARNLVEEGRLEFRADERAMGYTNPLWTMLAAAAFAVVGPDRLLPTMQAISALAGALLVAATAFAALRLGARRRIAALAAFATAATSGLALQAQSGLETVLYTMLLVAGFVALAPALDGAASALPGALLLAAAALTRPEGLAALVLAAVLLVHRRRGDRGVRRALAAAALLVAVAVAALWSVHGGVVPNTVVAKLGADYPAATRLAAGASYVVDAARATSAGWLLPLAAVTLLVRRAASVALAAALALLPWIESLGVGGDAMPGFRFVVPGLPFLAALAAAGGEALSTRVRPAIGRAAAACALALFALASQWLAPVSKLGAIEVAAAHRNGRLVAGYSEVARAFGAACRNGEELATDVAGAFGYFSGCRVLDTWGLASQEIAGRGGPHPDGRFYTFGVVAPEVVLERRPEYLVPFPPLVSPTPWPRERVVAALFPAGWYVGRSELDDYERAIVATPSGGFAFLVRRDVAFRRGAI